VPALTPAAKSASACRLAFACVDAAAVARALALTPARVRQWQRDGEGSPRLDQIFAAPRFARALLASAAIFVEPADVGEVPIRERLYSAMVTLGALVAASGRGRDLSDYSDSELAEQATRARDLEREGKAIADACERELIARRQRAQQADKGVR
jgi:hypothetical protein